jgi:hypothetical protein
VGRSGSLRPDTVHRRRRGLSTSRQRFIPFGVGPHRCIGSQLGYLNAQFILTLFFQRYRMRTLPGWTPKHASTFSTTLEVAHPCCSTGWLHDVREANDEGTAWSGGGIREDRRKSCVGENLRAEGGARQRRSSRHPLHHTGVVDRGALHRSSRRRGNRVPDGFRLFMDERASTLLCGVISRRP